MAGTPKIEIRDVHHVYTGGGLSVPALAGVNLAVADGEFVALLGPSGCGKSSLLRIIADPLRPSGGVVRIRSGGHLSILRSCRSTPGFLKTYY